MQAAITQARQPRGQSPFLGFLFPVPSEGFHEVITDRDNENGDERARHGDRQAVTKSPGLRIALPIMPSIGEVILV
jgi:hypothetical protein